MTGPPGRRVLRFDSGLWPLRVVVSPFGHAFGVHSEHDLKEQSDAQIIVSRFPFRGEGS